jgi:hypothetical protein
MKALLLCLVAVLAAANTRAAGSGTDFTGTWTGSFDIHFADGRVVADTAWIILQQSGATVTGTAGPDAGKQAAIREVSTSGNEIRFVADTTPGKFLQFVLKRDGDRLSGEANGDMGPDRVRVVVDTTRTASVAAAAPDPLYQKLLALDTAMFDSFNKCGDHAELRKHAAFFARDMEFYHDIGGLTLGADGVVDSTRKNVCGKFRRELDVASFRVYPIPGYGAMSLGTHRFCHTPTTCEGVAEFSMVWREKEGVWQITRALSYAHRSIN